MPKRKKSDAQRRKEDRERKRIKRSHSEYREKEKEQKRDASQSGQQKSQSESNTLREAAENSGVTCSRAVRLHTDTPTQSKTRRRSNALARKREQEQDTTRRRSKRLDAAVRQKEQEQDTTRRRSVRLDTAVRQKEQEQDTTRRRSVRLDTAVRQKEQEQDTTRRRSKRLDAAVCQKEQEQDTTRRRSKRLDAAVRQKEQEQDTTRRRSKRLDAAVCQKEQEQDTTRRRSARLDAAVRQKEQTQNTTRRRSVRLAAAVRQNEQQQDTIRRRAKRLVASARRSEQASNTIRRRSVRSTPLRKEQENQATRTRRQAARRLFRTSYEDLHKLYQAKKRSAPVHVCSCCGGLWYKESVSTVTESHFQSWGLAKDFIDKVLNYNQSPHKLCGTCKESIRKNKVPRLALSNGLLFPELPAELKNLSPLEERCVALRLPFTKIKLVGTERQSTLRGCVINVENNLDVCAKVIPRQMTETSMVEVKLMRRMRDTTPYMYEKVRPYKIYRAAKYLAQTPAYQQEQVLLSNDWSLRQEDESEDFIATTNPEIVERSEESDALETVDETEADAPVFSNEQSFIFYDKDSLTRGIQIAPAERNTLKPFYQDLRAEELSFPTIFGGQIRQFNKDLRITYTDMKKSELRMYDRRACTVDHIFYAFNKSRIEKIFNALQVFLRKTPGNTTMTAGDIRQPGCLESIISKDEGYSVFKEIRCSPPYWQNKSKEVVAMVRTLGTPACFLTLSAAETKWTELIVMLVKILEGKDISEAEAAELPYSDVCDLIRRDPVTCMRHFDHRYRAFYNHMLLKVNGVFEDVEVTDYFSRMEFQMRGSPHLHSLLWMKDAPKLDLEDPTSVIECANFIDRFITCERNEEGCMKKLIQYQLHNHSHTCYKNQKRKDRCRFGFPKPPMDRTRFLQPFNDTDNEQRIKYAKENFKKIQKKLNEMGRDFEEIIPFDEFLESLDLTIEEYMDAVRSSIKRVTPFLRRETNAIFVNQYNEKILKEWEANIDLQFVTDAYACAKYCVGYILKSESGVSKLLKAASDDARRGNLSIKEKLKQFARILITGTEISAQEAVAFLLGLSFTSCSRNVVYASTSPPLDRVRMLRPKEDLEKLDDSSTDILAKGLLDHYVQRPEELEHTCLADFATLYEFQKKKPKSYEGESENSETPVSTRSKFYKLLDGSGYIRERKVRKILRFRHYSRSDNTGNYWREQLMLFVPWRDESVELNNSTAEAIAKQKMELIISNSQPFYYDRSVDEDDLGRIIEETEEESREVDSVVENDMGFQLEVDEYEDFVNQDITREVSTTRVDKFTKPGLVDEQQYNKIMKELNDKQRRFVLNVIHQQKVSEKPFYYFLSGGAGVGKSRVVHALVQYYLRNESSHITNPEEICVLVSAPTGKAAHNVYGMTLHSSFKFPSSQGISKRPGKLNENTLNSLRKVLRNVKLFIIDEISMVSSNFLYYIDARLQDIFNCSQDFGGRNVIVVGHMRQLPPVKGRHVFLPPKFDETEGVDDILHNYLWDHFEYFELDEIMRQRGDLEFCEALNRMSEGCMREVDVELIKSRKLTESNKPPDETIRLFATRDGCNQYNNTFLASLTSEGSYAVAHDIVQGHASEKTKRQLLEYARGLNHQKCDGLPYKTFLKVGGCYFVSTNVDVQDGLFNGSTGILKKIEYAKAQNQESVPKYAWMEFEDSVIGSSSRAKTAGYQKAHSIPSTWTRIERDQRSLSGIYSFNKTNRVTLELIREQIPLIPANGMTVHKSQGSSLSSVVVSMQGIIRLPNYRELIYVACSRATSLNGLFIDGDFIAPKKPKEDDKVSKALQALSEKSIKFPFLFLQDVSISKERLYYHNVHSILGKVDQVISDQCAMSATLLAFVEPWLLEEEDITIPDFTCIHQSCCKRPRNSEGLLVYSKGDHSYLEYKIHRGNTTNSQCQFLVLQAKDKKIVLTYRHTTFSYNVYLEKLREVLVATSDSETIFIGDTNIDLRKPDGLRLISLLQEFKFESKLDINCPTHDNQGHIDCCFSNSETVIAATYESYYSDHKPICVVW